MNLHARIAYSIKHGFHLALTYLANAKKLEYENFFIFSASYRSTSKEYRLVSAKWKPCFNEPLSTLALNPNRVLPFLRKYLQRHLTRHSLASYLVNCYRCLSCENTLQRKQFSPPKASLEDPTWDLLGSEFLSPPKVFVTFCQTSCRPIRY